MVGAHLAGHVVQVLQVHYVPFQPVGDDALQHHPALPHGLHRGLDLPALAQGHRLVDEPRVAVVSME